LDKAVLKNILYGSIAELAKDSRYYYYSEFGEKYCNYTDEGQQAVLAVLKVWTIKLLEEEKRVLDKRAKELVVKGLKGEKI
jgi:hypothetical protein